MTDLRRRPVGGQPIAVRLRHFVLFLWGLLLVVCLTAVGALQVQATQVNRLTLFIGPAYDANVAVLQAMTDADAGLLRYQATQDSALLVPFRSERARTMSALGNVETKLLGGEDAGAAKGLERRQRAAVELWWADALSTEQAKTRADSTFVSHGVSLFDSFLRVNATLGRYLEAERAQTRVAARTTAAAGTLASILATLVALMVAFVLGRRVARSISLPMTELRDTVVRQRRGELGAKAREDLGSLELRSLAVDFNALTEQNVALQAIQARDLRMNQLTFEIASTIRATPGRQEALNAVCVALGLGLGVDRVMVNTVDANKNMQLGAQWHLPDLQSLGDIPDDMVSHVGELAEELWLTSERLTLDDLLAPDVRSQKLAEAFHRVTGARGLMLLPIGLGDRVMGMIYVLTVHQPRPWTHSEAISVQQVAGFVARAIVEDDLRARQSEYVERLVGLDRQKTDFLATVSHELRTPLTSISGYLELLQDGDAGELTMEQRRMLEVVDRNTSRLRGLIEDLLVLNRIESSGHKANMVGVSMGELISNTVQELSPLARAGAIELDIDAGPASAIVDGDAGHLHRALVNIVSNAIKFSRPDGAITVSCAVDQAAGRVIITCQDHGIGIPAADLGQLFTRFYRASNATDQAIPGTGLGLTIVQQIVEDHGGELRLSSVEGEGTTVVVDLPLSAGRSPVPDGNDSQVNDVFGIRA